MIIDLCKHYRNRKVNYLDFRRNTFSKSLKKPKNNMTYIPILFISKELENLGFKDILNDKDAFKLFPSKELSNKYSKDDFEFNICFKYLNSRHREITNYKHEIVKHNNDIPTTCFCHLYKDYINPDFGHVITGNVDIVTNNNLRHIFHKGFNFIESIYRNKAEILSGICNDLKIFTKKLSTKFSVSEQYFTPWLVTMKELINKKLANAKISCKRENSIFDK